MNDNSPSALLNRIVWTTQVPCLLTPGDINELHKRSEAIANLAILDVGVAQKDLF